GAVLFGYLARLGLIFLAVILVRDASWISLTALGLTIIVTHLGLLVWEMRYVAASLAFPALKPKKNA
ncbi:MAG: ATP synthase subunit I, partial [Actinobacteria bacterium]|nr:ATP synthase subunit I [Actinomycetota bacterium]